MRVTATSGMFQSIDSNRIWCPNCPVEEDGVGPFIKKGLNAAGHQRFRCKNCGKTFCETALTGLFHVHLEKSQLLQLCKRFASGQSTYWITRQMKIQRKTVYSLVRKIIDDWTAPSKAAPEFQEFAGSIMFGLLESPAGRRVYRTEAERLECLALFMSLERRLVRKRVVLSIIDKNRFGSPDYVESLRRTCTRLLADELLYHVLWHLVRTKEHRTAIGIAEGLRIRPDLVRSALERYQSQALITSRYVPDTGQERRRGRLLVVQEYWALPKASAVLDRIAKSGRTPLGMPVPVLNLAKSDW